MHSIRHYITLLENEKAQTPVDRFLTELWQETQQHPFDRHQRIVNNTATVEVRPDIDERERAVHISDIMSLYAGERQGAGRDALLFLLKLADKYGVTLTLTAKAYAKGPGSNKFPKTKALVEWYSHYGFVKKSGQMVRTPGTPIPEPRHK